MKNFIVVFILSLFSFQVNSQNFDFENLYLPKEEGKIIYQKVIELPGLKSDEIFKNANFWFIDTFKSPNDVINYNNPKDGIISGKGYLNLTWINENAILPTPVVILLGFSIRIEVKDERFRYSIFDLEMSDATLKNFRNVESQFVKEKMFSKKGKPEKYMWDWYYIYETAIFNLESSIEKGVIKNKNNDW
jgi:hypothetical protein